MKEQADLPTKEEVNQILALAKETNYPLFVLCKTLHKSGRRVGELYGVKGKDEWLFGVKIKDIDFKNKWMNTIILKKRKKIKDGMTRRIPTKQVIFLDAETLKLLKEYIESRGLNDEDYVFRYTSYRTIERHFAKIIKTLHITKNITLHSFRVYFITYFRKLGWDYGDIRKLTGHTKNESLSPYDRTSVMDVEKEARDMIEKM